MRFYLSPFTGKERDEETGYGYLPQQVRQAYHGARYMDHELMTMWLSVDPMADKYPNISQYNYCVWNPIGIINEKGEDPIKPLIKHVGNGSFMVNTENLMKVTRSQIEHANYEGAHDEKNIGVNLFIGSYHSPKAKSVVPAPLLQEAPGVDPSHVISHTPPQGNLKRNGKPYYNKYQWYSCAKGSGIGRTTGLVFFAVDLAVYATGMYQVVSVIRDNRELQRQVILLNKATSMVDYAIKSGNVFNDAQIEDNDFIGNVINYIFQGDFVGWNNSVSNETMSADVISRAKIIMERNNLRHSLLLGE